MANGVSVFQFWKVLFCNRRQKLIVSFVVAGLWFLLHTTSTVNLRDASHQLALFPEQVSHRAPERPKTILFWTSYHDSASFHVGYGQEPFIKHKCPVINCRTTSDRSLFNESDAVIFHAIQFHLEDLPKYRLPHQRFVFFIYETIPNTTIPNTTIPCVGKCLTPHIMKYPNYFNWTMTHRRDSDIYVADPYGAIGFNSDRVPEQLPINLPAGVLPQQASLLVQKRSFSQLKNRTKKVAWFASHCPTHSQREDYVAELSKYITVDIYGRCGPLKCLTRNDRRCEPLLKEYKFYLALENSICPDYVSEKFYRALDNEIIPIVYGGADYPEYAPPHSYINIADFPSPKALSEYLLLLDSNDALYMAYFQWRKHYHVIRRPMKGWCDLCRKLNDPIIEYKSYESVADWWVRKLPCYPGSSFLERQGFSSE